MTFSFYYTSILLVLMTVILIKEWLDVELTLFGILLLLLAARIITIEEAFAGFSSESMLSVGLLHNVGHYFLGNKQSAVPWKLMRLVVPTTAASAFINNTPLVAMIIPVVRSW